MTRRLRVLMVSPGAPLPTWGSGTRIYHLARYLAARHEVTLVTYAGASEDSALDPLREVCEVRVVTATEESAVRRRARQLRWTLSRAPFHARELSRGGLQAAIDDLLDRPFDIVQLESSQMGGFRLPAGRLVLDEHNIEYELLQRMYQGERSPLRRAHLRVEEAKVRHFEQSLWRRADGVALPSRREELVVHQHVATPTAVVPNSVDLDYFGPPDAPGDGRPSIVFTGLLSYRPNLDAARYLVDEIVPEVRALLPEAEFTVVGGGREADLDQLRRPGVTVTGWVRDVRPYMRAASVLVAPLRIGGGTRLKVVECLAMAKPMVSTAVGCEGLDVRDGEHLLVADDAPGFARSVVRLVDDPGLGRRLGQAGRALVDQKYTWEGAARQLEALYQRVLADPMTPQDASFDRRDDARVA